MNQQILQTWLNLPKAAWPPDPWTLLGLGRDVKDLATIEQRVQDRMTTLRGYQLSFPEEATEGMNRLAEAFVTLTETCSKSAEVAPPPAARNGKPISKDETSITDQTKTDWRTEPPPVRVEENETPKPILEPEGAADTVAVVARPFVPPSSAAPREIDPALARELAQESDEATHKLATIDAVIDRVDATRALLHAWDRLGKHLNATTKRATPKECDQFARRLEEIAEMLSTYPAFIGQPGIPGYRVMVLTKLRIPLGSVRVMTKDQRDALLFDWRAGRAVLLVHRKYLRRLVHSMRRRTMVGLALHAGRAMINDHPRATISGLVIVLLLAVLGGVAIACR